MKIFKPNNMKTVKNLVLLGIVMSAFLSSCTMQKCVYSKGYYVDWFDGKSKKMKLLYSVLYRTEELFCILNPCICTQYTCTATLVRIILPSSFIDICTSKKRTNGPIVQTLFL